MKRTLNIELRTPNGEPRSSLFAVRCSTFPHPLMPTPEPLPPGAFDDGFTAHVNGARRRADLTSALRQLRFAIVLAAVLAFTAGFLAGQLSR
jgi:hypothetical protein